MGNLLGVKQVIVGVNKMDSDVAGWKKDFISNNIPFLPISGWMGDNLIKKSENMDWWKGCDVKSMKGETIHIETLKEALNNFVSPPPRVLDKPMRLPISGIYKIKG